MPLKFLTDEDFNGRVLRGLLRRDPDLEIVRVQDVGLDEEPDPVVLEWAEQHERIVLTHDTSTMTAAAYDRLRSGLRIVGVCVVPQSLPIGQVIDNLVLTALCGREDEWENLVRFLPL